MFPRKHSHHEFWLLSVGLYGKKGLMVQQCEKKGPHAAYNAYKQFVQSDTTALFLAAAMEHFHLNDVRATPDGLIPDHIQQGSAEQKRTWLHDSVAEVVDKFLMSTDISGRSADVAEAARALHKEKEKHRCREPGCTRVFAYKKSRDNHEKKVHSLVVASMPVVEPAYSDLIDFKKEHTEARLSFGFLLFDLLDAVKEGDGERLIRLYKVALLIYKAYGHTQYAYSTFLLTVQVSATLSPQVAHDVTWNRFWNSRGGKGKNIPLDLHLEHLNNYLTIFVFEKQRH
ncbi:uncharacterized protein [Paramisgurnus dabryanus]|uniref:uncharacterized protein isoform X1 n=1 Tax=Paramisgurnus dabryanus TaxID=90735 RepID=UPI0031F37C1F